MDFSESNNQNDLLQQLKMLKAEKALLEKHVFVLNECLSVDELKIKISHLEKKKEMLISLEKLIEKLRTEIEPLKYLKSILENKLEIEDQKNKFGSLSNIDSKPNSFFNTVDCKPVQFQSAQNVTTDSTKTDSVLSQKLNDVLISVNQTPSNAGSIVNDNSLDECMHFLDQYDVVTDQEILHFSEENNCKIQNVNEPVSTTHNIDNEVRDIQKTSVTSTLFNDEGTNVQSITKESVAEKVNVGSCVNNLVMLGSTSSENNSSLHEASTSQSFQKQESLCSDSNASIGDLLLKIPRLLLQQGFDSIKVGDILNESLKNLNECTNEASKENIENNKTPDIEEGFNVLKQEVGKFLNGYEKLLSNSAPELVEKTNENESSRQSESSQCSGLPNTINYSEKVIRSFNDMNLKIDILRGIYSLGFVNPTVLQQRVIVHCLNGRDVIVFSGPGNGRTMMFTIPLLQRIKTTLNECQVLILVPTRDIAVHIQKIILSVGDFMGVKVCIGGDNVPKKLSTIPHVVVGTPAGVSNMISCKSLRTGCVQTVVLNQAEKMLTQVSIKLVEGIVEKLPRNKQVTLLASDKLDHILDVYMDTLRDPLVIINDDKENETKPLTNLPKQFYLTTQEDWKINALCEIIESLKLQKAVIFCNTLDRAQKLCETLQRLEYTASLFLLEINAQEREQKLNMFASGHLRMFITADPIKGNQFQHASWILNYDLPMNPTCYLDRVAKTAENIKVINIINEHDDHYKSAIETYNKSYFIQMPLNMIDLLQY